MRLNLKNAISFEAVDEKVKESKESFEKSMSNYSSALLDKYYYCSTKEKYVKKAHLILDFGTFERTVYFDNVDSMEEVIFKLFPENYEGICLIRED